MGKHYAWIAVILSGSLLEAVYMFRWFMQATRATHEETTVLLLPVEFFRSQLVPHCLLPVATQQQVFPEPLLFGSSFRFAQGYSSTLSIGFPTALNACSC